MQCSLRLRGRHLISFKPLEKIILDMLLSNIVKYQTNVKDYVGPTVCNGDFACTFRRIQIKKVCITRVCKGVSPSNLKQPEKQSKTNFWGVEFMSVVQVFC